MTSHAQIDARSLEGHQLIAGRIRANPALRAKALENIARWIAQGNFHSTPYLCRWRELLEGDLESLLAMMTSPAEEATALRQSTPFAGPTFISQAERIALIKKYAAL